MSKPLTARARARLRAECRRLAGHAPLPPAQALRDLAAWCEEGAVGWDHYGTGAVLGDLEAALATLLEKPAALFLPTGTMAQQIALCLWAQAAGTRRVAIPIHSHLELHEHDAHRLLSGLEPLPFGDRERVPGPGDLAALADPLAALLLELPAREIGGKLLPWSELVQLVAAARARDVRLHLDGARLFEAAAGYGCDPATLASLFDSVYVSLYKGIGGFAGAVLLGDSGWIKEARIWKRRYGGDPITLLPFAASAHMHLEERRARMPDYLVRARELAQAFGELAGVTVDPDVPQVNLFHLVLEAPATAVVAARDAVARETGLWLLNDPRASLPSDPDGTARIEITAGDATLAVSVDEATRALERLMAEALG